MIDQEFIDDILVNRLTKKESFEKHFPNLCTEGKDIEKLANSRFNRKQNLEYTQAKMKDIKAQEKKMTEWTRDESTKDLIEFKDVLWEDIKNKGKRTQAILMAYLQTIKELNLMNGFNEVNISSKSESITVIGFNYLKGVDENGKIIDIENNEVKKIEEPKEESGNDNELQELPMGI